VTDDPRVADPLGQAVLLLVTTSAAVRLRSPADVLALLDAGASGPASTG
jgi:hypothetical protein